MQQKRLESLDILRGLDMFLLTIAGPLVTYFCGSGHEGFLGQFSHGDWIGLTMWDMIMPLFLFMSGVTIPFSMAKYKRGCNSIPQGIFRIIRRVLLLWILGMIAQGNLLTLDWSQVKFYNNVLQAIAVGYFFCALLFLMDGRPGLHITVAALLLLAFWAAMEFIKIGPYGGGDYSKDYNLCQYIDMAVQGTRRGGSTGVSYYTFVPSSVNFVVTMIFGMLAGELLKSNSRNKVSLLLLSGVVCIGLGYLMGLEHPIIKKIWSSSFTLVSGGVSLVLMGICHWMFDFMLWGKSGLGWLKMFGTNALLAYMMHQVFNFYHINVWIQIAAIIIVLALFRWRKIYFRV